MSEEELNKLAQEAEKSVQQGEVDKAISIYNQIIEKDPRNANAYTKIAELYESKGLKQEAAGKYLFIGNAYYESRLLKGSMKFFQKVLELDPKCLDAMEKLALIYESEDMEREAKIEFLHLSEIYLEEKKLDKAEEFSQKAISLKSIEAHFVLGEVFFERGMHKEAITEFEYLLKFKPRHVEAMVFIGNCYLKMNKFPEAIIFYEKALKIEENNIKAMEGIATAYKLKGSPSDAAASLINVVKEYIKKGEKDNSLNALKEIEALSENNSDARNKLAELYLSTGDKENAKRCFCDAGVLYSKAKLKDKAQASYSKALEIDPDMAQAKSSLSELQSASKAQQEQKPEIKKDEDKKQETSNQKETVKKESEKPSADETRFEESVPKEVISGEADDLMAKAEQNLKEGFFQKAIDIYRHLLKLNPADMTVRQKLHQAYILAAQQEQEITDRTSGTTQKTTDGKKPKKSKISYL